MSQELEDRIKELGVRELAQALIDVARGVTVETAVEHAEAAQKSANMFLEAEQRKHLTGSRKVGA